MKRMDMQNAQKCKIMSNMKKQEFSTYPHSKP